MSIDTVTISLSRYDYLRNLEENIMSGKRVFIDSYFTSSAPLEFFTDDEMVKELTEGLNRATEELYRKEKRIDDLRLEVYTLKNRGLISRILNI